MNRFDITIIGAGVIGLAIAEVLSERFRNVLVLEKHHRFGQETSSRNSEVIHVGIHYPQHFLKSALCLEGNRLLYEICQKRRIPHRRLGKLIVATCEDECLQLEKLHREAGEKGLEGLVLLGEKQTRTLEPDVQARASLYSPATGIVDSHSLMHSFLLRAEAGGAIMAFRSEVTAVRYEGRQYTLEINGGDYRIGSRILINSAGLFADRIASMAGLPIDENGYRLKYAKGSYFHASPAPRLRHLVYPVPIRNNEGLGIHATLDLNGRIRFGPDTQYVDRIDYTVDEGSKARFHESIRTYLPALPMESLHPDMSGIRPKLQGPGEPARDFIVREEGEAGFPGLVNLIGIESPGLTSCLAIARRVLKLTLSCL
ncbi:MAG: NAD(P)/FAD-dependent oxidoreductase [Deltaproteobacteria bacterium]|nr:NAD(P)/FAD-dependent oxidoreductase [Deltaproteobacteria bacterium]